MIHKSEINEILHKSFIDGRDRDKIRVHIEKLERAISDKDDAANAKGKIRYIGGVQGVIHALFKEGGRPHVRLRDLQSEELVTCYFHKSTYSQVMQAMQDPDAVVFVSGNVVADYSQKRIESIEAERFRAVRKITAHEFKRLLGAAPDLTGNYSSAEFIARQRANED